MNISLNGTVGGFLLAVLVYFLFDLVINALVSDPTANKTFHLILLVLCICIALGIGLFVHA